MRKTLKMKNTLKYGNITESLKKDVNPPQKHHHVCSPGPCL